MPVIALLKYEPRRAGKVTTHFVNQNVQLMCRNKSHIDKHIHNTTNEPFKVTRSQHVDFDLFEEKNTKAFALKINNEPRKETKIGIAHY